MFISSHNLLEFFIISSQVHNIISSERENQTKKGGENVDGIINCTENGK